MKCDEKTIPQEHIVCFNDYIEKIINTRVDQEIAQLNNIIAEKFELGKFKSVNELLYAYKSLEKEYTKSRQKIAELEAKLAEKDNTINGLLEYHKIMEKSCSYEMFEDCQKQINQLKQQLAEKEQTITNLVEDSRASKELLKKQLVEKEKEIENQLENQKYMNELALDKMSKINIWLVRKYGHKLYEEFGVSKEDNEIETFIKINKVFDEIYEEMNQEFPLMWYKYGFSTNVQKDKGE